MGEQEKITFEVRDRLGRTVRLRESVYERHLPTHREMADYLEEAKQTLLVPAFAQAHAIIDVAILAVL